MWDVAGLPDDAAFLLGHGLPAMLPPLLTAAAAREQWRVLEIGLGVAANLACHKEAREQLLQLEGLPELLLDQLLWVDDSASLAELCRCVAGLLPGAARGEVRRAGAASLLFVCSPMNSSLEVPLLHPTGVALNAARGAVHACQLRAKGPWQ